ncbi:hypothetical protein [Marinobacterium halophilum]|nr:hypothetical protein [Marinobacterium halophilum]
MRHLHMQSEDIPETQFQGAHRALREDFYEALTEFGMCLNVVA